MILWDIIKFIVLFIGWIVFLVLFCILLIVVYFSLKNKIRNDKKQEPVKKDTSPANNLAGEFSGTTTVAGASPSGILVGHAMSIQASSGSQTAIFALTPPPAGSMDQKAIIQDLVNQTRDIVQRHPFYSWSLMMAGVELLGTFLDNNNPIFVDRESANRFKDAIDKLFPQQYHQYKDKLYKELRCGVNHYTLPKQTIILSERVYNKQNLSLDGNGNLILVAEDFFKDFKNACETVTKKLDTGEITAKIYHQLV